LIVQCLGCTKSMNMPDGVVKMAERVDGKCVAFCSRACNLKFVKRMGEKAQDENLRKLMEKYRC